MSYSASALNIGSLGALIAGCGMGVSVKNTEILDTHFTTSTTGVNREGVKARGVCNSINIISETTLVYEAGYEINLTTNLCTPSPILANDGIGMDYAAALAYAVSDEDLLILDLHSDLIDEKPYQSVSVIVKNQQVADWLASEGLSYANERNPDADEDEPELEINQKHYLHVEDAEDMVDEIQKQLGYSLVLREEKEGRLSDELIAMLKRDIKSEVAKLFSLPRHTY